MICRTYLTTFAILEDDSGYPIEFAAFSIAEDGNRNYRFHMHRGGLWTHPSRDLAWRILAHVLEGSDILSVIPLSGQRPLAESFEISAPASASRMLGLPIEGYGRMHVLRTSEWQLVQSAFDRGLRYRGLNRKRGRDGQIALLPLRAQAIGQARCSCGMAGMVDAPADRERHGDDLIRGCQPHQARPMRCVQSVDPNTNQQQSCERRPIEAAVCV